MRFVLPTFGEDLGSYYMHYQPQNVDSDNPVVCQLQNRTAVWCLLRLAPSDVRFADCNHACD